MNKFFRLLTPLVAAGACLAFTVPSAFAGGHINWSINLGAPAYYGPPPVYYGPPPVVYRQAPAVIYTPPP
ncbi:MAG: hypothetical protein ABI351_02320, partial [Herbaspirillum sp.]